MIEQRTKPVTDAPIAVIGMACIFPGARDLQAFWNNILNCVDAIGEPLPAWGAQRYLDSGRIKTQFGGFLRELYRFDAAEFGIMPNSINGSEPDQFLALRVARDARRPPVRRRFRTERAMRWPMPATCAPERITGRPASYWATVPIYTAARAR